MQNHGRASRIREPLATVLKSEDWILSRMLHKGVELHFRCLYINITNGNEYTPLNKHSQVALEEAVPRSSTALCKRRIPGKMPPRHLSTFEGVVLLGVVSSYPDTLS